jgi:pimeloyl-ACP methyl ester carboxylesterase
LGKDDTLAEYKELGIKGTRTLIFYGKEDKTIPPEDIATLRELVPDHEYHAIDAAGHIPHYEQAEVVNPLLVNFLKTDPKK